MRRQPAVLLAYAAVLSLCLFVSPAVAEDAKPHAKVIALDSAGKSELQILGGPPETVTMRSGLITLAPGKSVGKHTTGQHEEMLLILAGHGEMIFDDGSSLPVQANHALYCPPDTQHDVKNTGTETLRYVYIVAAMK